jgi:hypothetical protein
MTLTVDLHHHVIPDVYWEASYPRDAISIGGLRQLQNTAELDDGERRAVLGGSAVRLIPRLARVESPV